MHPNAPQKARTCSRLAVGVLITTLFGELLAGTSVAGAPAKAPTAGRITWKSCTSPDGTAGFECATLKVPVDWKKPGGATIDLALNRLPATDRAHRIGSLLINPGGPGGSGVDFAFSAPESFSSALRARFDIVGFDPRGVGRSNAVMCDADLIIAQNELLFPDDAASFASLRKANRDLGRNCRDLSGKLFDHMDTASVVRDMEAIRAGLGERRISYYGVSYGTAIGQQYAERYPRRIRAMTLDSNMDHSLGAWAYQKTEAVAMEGSFGQFADWCARTTSCALHDRDVRALYKSLARRAADGIVLPGDPPHTYTLAELRNTALGAMYDPSSWFEFAADLARLDAAKGSPSLTERGHGKPEEYGYLAVTCQDNDFGLRSYKTLAGYERKLARISPVTRVNPLAWTDLTGCQNWPNKVTNPQHRLRVDGTPPILMTNSRYDVATPHSWGANAARQIGHEAVLLTYDGVGHGDYWMSPCAQGAIDKYLLTLKTPRKGAHCPAVWPTGTAAQRQSAGGLVNPLPGLLGPTASR
ncbi:alpha/beta hydrolase [Streptomyces scabiei]|uniref:alpha/beta hydrolase n=1 Tax=Streptomyces scabiei TaxID=1930 RepID=UPI000765B67C|nr:MULTISPECIES: alpha/beta hydrolase [Streptomyces]MBP5889622.1 alpha/beta hydrolase [Streptomyces sp. LBUM 1481]MBP5919646.1 alpha/beta hydrolase [Streptomyces sp. LBUM 1483]MDX2688347.1 alpha/beta hydrolase [Streptomyces scabiei]MDX2753495.1 alpha/beta hydrolase [Streptomyces scabiei]MDX2803862.1 alpha/beta hydrolase [Streptomyces scabiei]